jgi:hypothetical protein
VDTCQLAENRYALAAKALREVTPLISTDVNGAAAVDDSSHGRMLFLMVWSTATRQCAAALDPVADDGPAALTVEIRWAATFIDLALVLGAFATADQQAHMLRLSARLLLQRNQLDDALLRATEAAARDHSVQSHALVALVQLAAGNTRDAQAAVRAITAALPPSDVADALVTVAKQAADRGAGPVVLDAITALLLHTDRASALSAAGGSWALLSDMGVAAVSAASGTDDAVTASSLGLVCSIAERLLQILPLASATTPSDTAAGALAGWAAALLGRIGASLAEERAVDAPLRRRALRVAAVAAGLSRQEAVMLSYHHVALRCLEAMLLTAAGCWSNQAPTAASSQDDADSGWQPAEAMAMCNTAVQYLCDGWRRSRGGGCPRYGDGASLDAAPAGRCPTARGGVRSVAAGAA